MISIVSRIVRVGNRVHSGLTSDSVIFGYHARSESSKRLLAKGLLPFIGRAICLRANRNSKLKFRQSCCLRRMTTPQAPPNHSLTRGGSSLTRPRRCSRPRPTGDKKVNRRGKKRLERPHVKLTGPTWNKRALPPRRGLCIGLRF